MHLRNFYRASSVLVLALAVERAQGAVGSNQQELEFFEAKIRPLLVENCYQCHSQKAEPVRGGLRLDSPNGILKGGSNGPVVMAGNAEGSRLVKAVRYTDSRLKMPPKNKKLSAPQVTLLETWINMGAPLPRSGAGQGTVPTVDEARARHWAFQPITRPAIPDVKTKEWVRTPVDNFVMAGLEKKRLSPAVAADRRTFIRRVTYDLIGLPPSCQEVEDFDADSRPDAYQQLVERLLASPHYGERWGRYWLDVARYADTKGYLAGGEERRYAFSYTYRDYVVRALNEDKPYDQFLTEQIAADKLSMGDDKSALAALGFLTLGRRFLNNQNDIIDDRIDVVSRGTLGLTVTCARCHDHKFDPISSKDYYGLHGVFASSEEPGELPLLRPLKDSADYRDYLKEKAKIEAEIPEFKRHEVEKFMDELKQQVGDYMLGAHDAPAKDAPNLDTFAGERKLNPVVLRRWMADLETREKKSDPVFLPWFALIKLPATDFQGKAKVALGQLVSEHNANQIITKSLVESSAAGLKDVARVYDAVFKEVESAWKAALGGAGKQPVPTSLPDADREALRQVLYAPGPVNLPKEEAESILARRLTEGTAPFRSRIEALSWTHPGAPPRAMALVDRTSPANSHVLLRGNPGNPGEEAPRRFLSVLSMPGAVAFTNGSGRLDLARAIVSRDNPLTARVYVNRIWLHHFGQPLVSTPGDFGVRTEEPVQRGLLDYLAASFMESGWSTKSLHRLILLSATYQQSCDASPATLKADPDNSLISRMNRQRLDFEALRDTLLCIGGTADLSMGGLPVELEHEPFPKRRTLYGLVDRQNLPGMFRTFDFANPDTSNQGRFHTTVPQQALFLMNSPFVIEQARNLAAREEVKRAVNPTEKVQALYRLVFQRPAAENEVELGQRLLMAAASGTTRFSSLEKYAQVLLLSNEVMFTD